MLSLATFDQNFVKSCRNFRQKLKRKVAGFQNKSYGQGNLPVGALSIGIHRQLTVLLPLGNFPVRFPSHVFSVSIRHKLVLALPMLLLYPTLRVGINSCAIGFSSVGLGFVQVNSQQRVPIVLCSVSRARLHTAQIPSTHCCVCVCARRTPLSPRVPRALVGRGDFPFSIPALLTSMSDIRTNVLLPTIFDTSGSHVCGFIRW